MFTFSPSSLRLDRIESSSSNVSRERFSFNETREVIGRLAGSDSDKDFGCSVREEVKNKSEADT